MLSPIHFKYDNNFITLQKNIMKDVYNKCIDEYLRNAGRLACKIKHIK